MIFLLQNETIQCIQHHTGFVSKKNQPKSGVITIFLHSDYIDLLIKLCSILSDLTFKAYSMQQTQYKTLLPISARSSKI